MSESTRRLAAYDEMIGTREIFESEVPGLVSGTEVYQFEPEGRVKVTSSDDRAPWQMNVALLPQADGFDVQFSSGKIYARWVFAWKGDHLELSHNLHPHRSLLRRVGGL